MVSHLTRSSQGMMRSAWTIGRTCLRQQIPRAAARQALRHSHLQGALRRWNSTKNGYWRSPPGRNGLLLATAVGLSPLAFVQMSEKDNAGTEQTFEGRMLEASRDEIKKEVSSDVHGFRRFKDSIFLFVDLYVWEPICTGLRFLHLVVIFVPVLVSVPAIWVGKRDKARGNERSGTLWWYWFLVRSMERAGPAFIKASLYRCIKRAMLIFQ
jgi:aarF domain-containing kinase